jgi:hypothetical protein
LRKFDLGTLLGVDVHFSIERQIELLGQGTEHRLGQLRRVELDTSLRVDANLFQLNA